MSENFQDQEAIKAPIPTPPAIWSLISFPLVDDMRSLISSDIKGLTKLGVVFFLNVFVNFCEVFLKHFCTFWKIFLNRFLPSL